MKNFIQPGDTLTVTAPAGGANSGDAVLIGNLFGVAAYTAPAGAPLEIVTQGVFELPKTGSAAFATGDKAYWDATAKNIAPSANGLAFIGVIARAAAQSAALVRVRLNQTPVI